MKELLAQLTSAFPDGSLLLNPPSSEQAVEQYASDIQTDTGFEAPPDVLDLVRWRNGQSLKGSPLFPCYRHLVGLERIRKIQHEGVKLHGLAIKDQVHEATFEYAAKLHDDRIRRDRLWQKGWFPFGAGSDKTLLVDLTPAEGGKEGQVVLWDSHGPYGIVVGHSLQDFLQRTIAAIEGEEFKRHGFYVEYAAID